MGACLFSARRFRCSAEAYSRALGIEEDATVRLHLADAMFGTGRVRDAAEHYFRAAESGSGPMTIEADLKLQTCRWLEGWIGPVLPVRTSGIVDVPNGLDDEQAEFDHWYTMVTEVDATNHLAHFNLGVIRARRGDFRYALGDFLVCAILRSGDAEAWSNAAICAMRVDEPEMLAAVLAVAFALAGDDAYERMRADLLGQAAPDELIEALDEAAAVLDGREAPVPRSRGVTLRSLEADGFDVVARIGAD